MFAVKLLLALFVSVNADTYMQIPRGSNNRLDGNRRERLNANRLFDSQNNDRGGYNVGRDYERIIDDNGREKRKEVGEMTYYAGSELTIEWTNQHECGGKKAQCDVIIQYMCDKALRDGYTTATTQDRHNRCSDQNCNSQNARRYGQQEQVVNYQLCRYTERNQGLFTADQELKGKSAIYTRQNPGGTRRGLECPEERDYYPYWRSSPWKDIAILTTHPERCAAMQAESSNVKGKSACIPKDPALYFAKLDRLQQPKDSDLIPNNKEECETKTVFNMGFRWINYPPSNLPAPDCKQALKSRDNHLGNGGARPYAHVYNWTIPNLDADACALRLRYNISTGDYPAFTTTAANNNPANNAGEPKLDIGSEYGLDPTEAKARGYYLKNNPEIKPLKVGAEVQDKLNLELAINTAQIGRTFQDRSHAFKIKPRPANIPADAKIYNLNVRGKRGNIVQVFPATEYDYAPNSLNIKQGDYVHTQWTGSNKNPQNNDGEGRRGTDRSNIVILKPKNYPEGTGANADQPKDRIGHLGNSYPETVDKQTFLGLSKNNALRTAVLVPELLGLIKKEKTTTATAGTDGNGGDGLGGFFGGFGDQTDGTSNDEEDTKDMNSVQNDNYRVERTRQVIARRLRLQTLDDAPAYFDLGPQKANKCEDYKFMCTRNNNFSNRSQKGSVKVECKK